MFLSIDTRANAALEPEFKKVCVDAGSQYCEILSQLVGVNDPHVVIDVVVCNLPRDQVVCALLRIASMDFILNHFHYPLESWEILYLCENARSPHECDLIVQHLPQ